MPKIRKETLMAPTCFRFDSLLQKEGWLSPAFVSVNKEGSIQKISSTPPENQIAIEQVSGLAIPGFQNAHSHAFQYAMAGQAEHLPIGAASDDFWSWRKAMYQLALHVSPEQLEAIATMLYCEMVRHGYTSVAEFHYLHHQKDGTPFENKAEMGERLILAAEKAGIEITLIPIFYQQGGFGKPPLAQQTRFLSPTIEAYQSLLLASQSVVQQYQHASLAVGIHSLRAVKAEDVKHVFQHFFPELPSHIHIAEQEKEVQDCLQFLGERPIQWLLEHANINDRVHLVHATHISEQEMKAVVDSGASVVLCPSTEGNLGDGFFPIADFLRLGGKWSIGTDSHIGLSPHEEIRILDYGQRLQQKKRNVFCLDEGQDSGQYAFQTSLHAGQKAMGSSQEQFFEEGYPLNAAVYDSNHPLLASCPDERRLSIILYALDSNALLGTMTKGIWRVQANQHILGKQATEEYISSCKSLLSSL